MARHTSEARLLDVYRKKRDFASTPEPSGSERRIRAARLPKKTAALRFVVQKHRASHMHYDFRLEAEGVLKSWAVPKGPTLDPSQKRLAMQTEDHPLGYYDFEGVIPSGYGAGEVVVWDMGSYEVVAGGDPAEELARGRMKFTLRGEKLRGTFMLVRMRGGKSWLLIKDKDDAADPDFDVDADERSVISGITLADLHGPRSPKKAAAPKPKPKAARKNVTLPKITSPMLATLIDGPFDDPGWLFEIKWDGFRAICDIDAKGNVTARSRNGKDLLTQFPELAGVSRAFDLSAAPLRVDGEIVMIDDEGRSSFQALQNRLARGGGARYVVFDCLFAEGKDLRSLGCEERKRVLERVVDTAKRQKQVIYSKHVVGDGTALFRAAQEQHLEGIIGKRRDAPYVEKRTRDWVKIKVQLVQEAVVAGWTEPSGSREAFGSLLLGLYDHGRFVYAGRVGTGFDRKVLASVMKAMKPLATDTCPFATKPKTRTPAHWVKPKLVAQIQFTEWTDDGRMRHPTFLGLRDDKKPEDCTKETPWPRTRSGQGRSTSGS